MARYVPSSANAARLFGGPDSLFHPGFWQSFLVKELHEFDNLAPYQPQITSPNGGENISGRYFVITWNEANPRDPNSTDGDVVHYYIEYTLDDGGSWFQAYDNVGDPIVNIFQGTTSIVWDLGAIPDTTLAKIRICPIDSFGEPGPCDESNNVFTISGGTCF